MIFPWGRGRGFMHTVMSRPEPKTLFFNSREPEKEWDLTSELVFTKYGMINTRVFVNDNITAKKYYKVKNKPNIAKENQDGSGKV